MQINEKIHQLHCPPHGLFFRNTAFFPDIFFQIFSFYVFHYKIPLIPYLYGINNHGQQGMPQFLHHITLFLPYFFFPIKFLHGPFTFQMRIIDPVYRSAASASQFLIKNIFLHSIPFRQNLCPFFLNNFLSLLRKYYLFLPAVSRTMQSPLDAWPSAPSSGANQDAGLPSNVLLRFCS